MWLWEKQEDEEDLQVSIKLLNEINVLKVNSIKRKKRRKRILNCPLKKNPKNAADEDEE